MSMGITIDINGQVIERIIVQQVDRLDDAPFGKRRYRVIEAEHRADGSMHHHAHDKKVLHRRKDGALHLAAKVCEYLSYERRKR